MKISLPKTVAIVLVALAAAGTSVHAATYNFYVSSGDRTTGAATFTNYQFDTVSGLSTVQSYSPFGVTASLQIDRSVLTLSGDKNSLAWAGFNGTSNVLTTFNLTSHAFDTSTVITGGAYVSAWTQDGTRFYVGGVSSQVSPGTVAKGGTTPTAMRSTGSYSVNTIRFNGGTNYLYLSRISATASGIYRLNATGQTTTATTWTALSGNAGSWDATKVYGGFDFVGNTLFVANTTDNHIDVFRNTVDATATTNWDKYITLDLSALGVPAVQQVSMIDLGSGSAQLFFTGTDGTSSAFGTATYTWDPLANGGLGAGTFGTVSILGTSSSAMFQGIAAIGVVPEPSSAALVGLGFAMVLIRLRRNGKVVI